MEMKQILNMVDHTLLKQESTWEQIKEICDDGMKYETASVCIPPAFVKQAKEYVGNKLQICTVIGFPNGYNTTAVKCFETEDAVKNGADEIDMVINIGALKDGDVELVYEDIKAVVEASEGHVVKVIIETCLLSDEEKIAACEAAAKAKASFVKTSTGFSTAGATAEDVKLMKDIVGNDVQVKAAGGVRSFDDMVKVIEAGATRIGTSAGCQLVNGEENNTNY